MVKILLLVVIAIMATISVAQKSEPEWKWKLSSDSKIKWSDKCDFPDISSYDTSFEIKSQEKCQELCLADERCTHYTHETPLGGICYLKTSHEVSKEEGVGPANRNTACGYVIHRVGRCAKFSTNKLLLILK